MRNIQKIFNLYRINLPRNVKNFSSTNKNMLNEVNYLRNIGILAHIDAGKTTTTERMLFYSGTIRTMGEVHHGNTVTDFMEQERERGITITSASVSFNWRDHTFNLIDTPGHIDFTMEVEQTLNVLDGAIIVLDGSAGVEAQTVTVWKQADKYNIPRIVYVNKIDRRDADVSMCCSSIQKKLEKPTILIQLPIKEQDKLIGLVDILTLEKVIWETTERGKVVKRSPLLKNDDHTLWQQAKELRNIAADKLSETDDQLAEMIIQSGSLENISALALTESLRKTTLNQKAVPVLCGSSYKNIGVQPLMDSVISYLPSPVERNKQFLCFGHNLCARAFKVMYNKQKGPLVFFRVYSGKFVKGQKIYNIHQNISEQTGRLLAAYADDFQEIPEVTNGNIAVVTGLKKTVSGDMISSSSTAFSSAKQILLKQKDEKNNKTTNEDVVNKLFGISRTIPEPVFFCSIEPPSLAYQTALENALNELQREDPSLRVSHNSDTGQTVLAGMGELHLEIIKDRIKKEYKVDAELGPLQIAYKESPVDKAKTQHILETKVGNSKHHVNVTISIEPCLEQPREILKLDKSPESASNLANLHPKHLLAVKQGVDVAVNHGPKLSCPVVNTLVTLHFLEVGRGTSETMISAAITQTIQKLLTEVGTKIWEPVMNLEVVTCEEHISSVLADLSRRRAAIQQIDVRGMNKVIYASTPLSELMGYSTDLRTITSGTASFTMEFYAYEQMSTIEEASAIKSVVGF